MTTFHYSYCEQLWTILFCEIGIYKDEAWLSLFSCLMMLAKLYSHRSIMKEYEPL